jgi:hypothetical protein
MTDFRSDDDPVEFHDDEDLAVLPDDIDDDDLEVGLDDERPIDDVAYESDDDIFPEDE